MEVGLTVLRRVADGVVVYDVDHPENVGTVVPQPRTRGSDKRQRKWIRYLQESAQQATSTTNLVPPLTGERPVSGPPPSNVTAEHSVSESSFEPDLIDDQIFEPNTSLEQDQPDQPTSEGVLQQNVSTGRPVLGTPEDISVTTTPTPTTSGPPVSGSPRAQGTPTEMSVPTGVHRDREGLASGPAGVADGGACAGDGGSGADQ